MYLSAHIFRLVSLSPPPLLPCFSCHVCGFETELNVQFVSHMSLHVDKEQWMFSICCTACDFVTMEEAEIKTHIGTKHTGKPPLSISTPCTRQRQALGRDLMTAQTWNLLQTRSCTPSPHLVPVVMPHVIVTGLFCPSLVPGLLTSASRKPLL